MAPCPVPRVCDNEFGITWKAVSHGLSGYISQDLSLPRPSLSLVSLARSNEQSKERIGK